MRTAFIVSIVICVLSAYFCLLAGFFVALPGSPPDGDAMQLLRIVHGLFLVVAVLSLIASIVLGVLYYLRRR